MNIQEKITQCEAHGFKVKKERNWLWLTGTDGRYKKENTKTGRINLDQETKVLFALGFKYSKSRGQYYWDGADYNTLYKQAKQRAEQLKKEIENIQKQIEKLQKEIETITDSVAEKLNKQYEQTESIAEVIEQLKKTDFSQQETIRKEIEEQSKRKKSIEKTLSDIEKEMKRYKSRLKAAETI